MARMLKASRFSVMMGESQRRRAEKKKSGKEEERISDVTVKAVCHQPALCACCHTLAPELRSAQEIRDASLAHGQEQRNSRQELGCEHKPAQGRGDGIENSVRQKDQDNEEGQHHKQCEKVVGQPLPTVKRNA